MVSLSIDRSRRVDGCLRSIVETIATDRAGMKKLSEALILVNRYEFVSLGQPDSSREITRASSFQTRRYSPSIYSPSVNIMHLDKDVSQQ